MKIDLKQSVKTAVNGTKAQPLGQLLERALFEAVPGLVKEPRILYDKIHGKKEVDLKVEDLAALKKACNALYISGVAWSIEDVLEGKTKEE